LDVFGGFSALFLTSIPNHSLFSGLIFFAWCFPSLVCALFSHPHLPLKQGGSSFLRWTNTRPFLIFSLFGGTSFFPFLFSSYFCFFFCSGDLPLPSCPQITFYWCLLPAVFLVFFCFVASPSTKPVCDTDPSTNGIAPPPPFFPWFMDLLPSCGPSSLSRDPIQQHTFFIFFGLAGLGFLSTELSSIRPARLSVGPGFRYPQGFPLTWSLPFFTGYSKGPFLTSISSTPRF